MRKKIIFITLIAILVVSSLLGNARLWAASEDSEVAMEIVKKMKNILEPEKPSIRKVIMSVIVKGETVRKIIMGQTFKTFPDGKRMLLVMLTPDDVKGIGYLIMERKNSPDIMFEYLPFIRRVRELSGAIDPYASFFGTDFTYSDLGFINLRGNYSMMGEEVYEGTDAYKIEEKIPLQPVPFYSKIITWIAKDSMLPLRRDYYEASGELWKSELFKDTQLFEDMPMLKTMRIIMKDVQSNTSTELQLSDSKYCGTLSDELFNPKNLPKVSEDPVWQPYCIFPVKEEK